MDEERRTSGEFAPRRDVWDEARRERYRRMLEISRRPLPSDAWEAPHSPAHVR